MQKLLGLSFVLVFGGVGITYVVSSLAASMPPFNITHSMDFVSVGGTTAADGVKADTRCASVYGKTGYGNLAYCMQIRVVGTSYQSRGGYYSPATKVFSPATSWLTLEWKPAVVGSFNFGNGQPYKCPNLNNYFAPAYSTAVSTGYGPTLYGQIYRYYGTTSGGTWQIQWANVNIITGKCYPAGSWMNAIPW